MTMTRNDVRHGIDEAARPRLLWRGFLVLAALSLVAEFAVHLHPHFVFEAVFGFAAWLGLAAGIALVAVAGVLARLLGRPDTYYGGAPDA
jgi:hypothetical protein